MISADYVRTMVRYGGWMNQRMMVACSTLPASERERDLGAFFGSLHRTLDHLLWADLIWMHRLMGTPAPAAGINEHAFPDWAELVARRAAADGLMARWAGEMVTDAWLAAPFTYGSKVVGRRRTMPGWVLVTHVLNHGTHHRGQATTLMKQLGADPGVTDLLVMPALFDGSLGITATDEAI
ncbi:DinB family protein [Niveispirillum fermenti]|uniref:DinB family protein n=1 Tax=Niveispirillum fermenti TaxID=1233113 RepID=UPI003A8BC292